MIDIRPIGLYLALVLGLILSLGTAVAGNATTAAEAVPGSSKAAKLDACVAPTDFMRRSHFELIKHQRDITVREGIRKTDDSLAGCVSCHANHSKQGGFVPVTAEKQFCAGCHQFTGVSIDCFTCHASKPTAGK